jgi:NADPH:quinone reductase-like Zn-dependent oxidoreductase
MHPIFLTVYGRRKNEEIIYDQGNLVVHPPGLILLFTFAAKIIKNKYMVERREVPQKGERMTAATMKAVICTKYGAPEVLKIDSVEKPVPKDNEVLIKVYTTTVHVGDTRIRKADIFLVRLAFGLFRPGKNRILGMELSGEIESVGKSVTLFKKGDKVFAYTGLGLGAYAEYKCMPEKSKALGRKGFVALKPENLSCEEAAAVPAGGITALKNLQKAHIREGHTFIERID